jgi:hypothetical protein
MWELSLSTCRFGDILLTDAVRTVVGGDPTIQEFLEGLQFIEGVDVNGLVMIEDIMGASAAPFFTTTVVTGGDNFRASLFTTVVTFEHARRTVNGYFINRNNSTHRAPPC